VTEGASEQRQGRRTRRMRWRPTAWLAWSVCAAALMLFGLSLLLVFLGWSTPLPKRWVSWQGQIITTAGFIGAPILGGLVASRRPENLYGWLWLGLGLSASLLQLAGSYAAYALVVEPGSLPAPRTVGQVLGMAWGTGIILLPFLLLLFPTGRLPSQRWRPVAWIVLVAGAVLLISGPFTPGNSGIGPFENPLGARGEVGEAIVYISAAVVFAIFAAVVLSALSLVFRYRRAGGIERQQIKWFAYAAVLFGGSLVFGGFLGQDLPGIWDALFETVTFIPLYVAVGVAILRYRLYDIDVLINRTLVYGSLTVMLAAVYFGGVVATQAIFRVFTGQEEQPQLAVVVSTLVIAALFNPLRRRIQGFIDRRFYRSKYDARKTLEAFSAKLRDETDLDALNAELVGVVRETMQPAHVSLWLRPDTTSKGQQTD
jgi:MFS family permease